AFFFSSRRRHTRFSRDWSSDVCSSDLLVVADAAMGIHYAHLAGNDDGTPLVHGDIRPETLMVSFGGVCQVTGYGALGVAPKESRSEERRVGKEGRLQLLC